MTIGPARRPEKGALSPLYPLSAARRPDPTPPASPLCRHAGSGRAVSSPDGPACHPDGWRGADVPRWRRWRILRPARHNQNRMARSARDVGSSSRRSAPPDWSAPARTALPAQQVLFRPRFRLDLAERLPADRHRRDEIVHPRGESRVSGGRAHPVPAGGAFLTPVRSSWPEEETIDAAPRPRPGGARSAHAAPTTMRWSWALPVQRSVVNVPPHSAGAASACRRRVSVEFCRYAPSSRLAGTRRGIDLDDRCHARLALRTT